MQDESASGQWPSRMLSTEKYEEATRDGDDLGFLVVYSLFPLYMLWLPGLGQDQRRSLCKVPQS